MVFRDDFEKLQGNIPHRHHHPFINTVVRDLLTEETHLKTQAGKGLSQVSSLLVLVVPSKPFLSNQTKQPTKVSFDECSFCKQKRHWKAQCPKLLHKTQTSQ